MGCPQHFILILGHLVGYPMGYVWGRPKQKQGISLCRDFPCNFLCRVYPHFSVEDIPCNIHIYRYPLFCRGCSLWLTFQMEMQKVVSSIPWWGMLEISTFIEICIDVLLLQHGLEPLFRQIQSRIAKSLWWQTVRLLKRVLSYFFWGGGWRFERSLFQSEQGAL